MVTMRTKILTAGLSMALLFVMMAPGRAARAIEGESIVLSPASVRLNVGAGETQTGSVKIINDGTTPYDFTVYASPYSVANGTYEPSYDAKKPNADLYTWVTFSQKDFSLKPGESVDVSYKISIPADAAPGGHYSVLFAETQAPSADGGQIVRKKRVGSLVYATVAGDYVSAGKQIDALIDWLQLGGPLAATVSVENSGNIDYTMTDLIEVQGVFGGTLYKKSSERVILPKTTRDINLAWLDGPIMGLYKVKVETKILDKVAVTNSWVLLMPMWILVAMIGTIVAIIYIAFFRRRRHLR